MARQSIPLKSIVLYFFIFFLTIGAVSLGAQTPPPWTPITGNQYNMVALGNVYRNGVLLSGSGY